MKRTNLMLNEQTLEEALRLSGERTYSATVNRALDEFVRRIRAGHILDLAGSGLWEGDLADMRRDASASGRGGRSRGGDPVVLIDTSAWIQVFRKKSKIRLESLIDLDEIVTCLPVIHEVLQGFPDETAYRIARNSLLAFPVVESPLRVEVFEEAVELYRLARRTGRTIRSGVDCLIATCAIRNGLEVMHFDRDYDVLADLSPLQERSL